VVVPLEAFSEVHGAPVQRFYNMLCMAFGADRETFGDLVANGYLPQARARNCRVEFGEANFAFQQTVRPSVDRDMAKKVLEGAWLPAVLEHPDLPPPVPEAPK
jgi:Putative metallopeptidase